MKTNYTVEGKTLTAQRSFKAPKSKVWKFYTTAELLDQWWGPSPYKAVTKDMAFEPGGAWRYVMSGPEGDAHHCILKYKAIDPENSFSAHDAFANEDWSVNNELPTQDWDVSFVEEGDMTHLKVVMVVQKEEDMETLVNMGMKEGFDIGLNQLEALLA